MIRVNLIPPEFLENQRQRTQNMRIAGGAVVILVVFTGLTFMHIQSTVAIEKDLRQKESALRELDSKVSKVTELEALRAASAAHLDALNGLISSRYYYPVFLSDIEKGLPATVWMTELRTQLREDGKIDFTITASARNGDDVALWLSRLEDDGKFSNVNLGQVNVGPNLFTFPITGLYATKKM
ncbi:MAG: PilN domain-containing protein [Elusimicrobiales bacterium]|nr:PilN domain-containing protein [Elusimicrobiales bacterium]